jgi:type 1 glutamine amidotransferase
MSGSFSGIVIGNYLEAPYHKLGSIEGELRSILSTSGELTFTEDRAYFDYEKLSRFDICILYVDCWEKRLSEEQMAGLLSYTASGGKLLIIHNGISYQNNPEFAQLVGGKFIGHPPYQKLSYKIVKGEHPIVEGITDFEMEEELYTFELDNLCDKEILMTATEGVSTAPAAWVKAYGKGKVVYLAPGHDKRSFENESFRKLIENSVLWALGETV